VSVTQPTATGGTAVTRFAYTATTTVVADPNTDQAQSVSAVPRTTYTLTGDGQKLIASVTDPTGNVRSASYTPFLDVSSATDTAGTASGTYGANAGESLTGTTGQAGATSAFTYGTTASTQYQPASSTDAQGNSSAYTYNGAGNRLSAADAGNNTASVTYNTDGTVATATSPRGAVTSYGYTAKQPTSITPPAGTTLAARAYTYDGYGRLRTATSGRG
jgi:YD repeat-containing protein